MSEQLRAILQQALDSGVSKYRIAKDSGLTWPVVHRFSRGEGLRLDQLDKLAAYFNVQVTQGKPRK